MIHRDNVEKYVIKGIAKGIWILLEKGHSIKFTKDGIIPIKKKEK